MAVIIDKYIRDKELKSSENEFLTEKMTFIYPEHPQCEIYVSVRYDTLKVVLFDARKIYFK